MVFSEVFERFVAETPACVMYRATMENMFAPAVIDDLFKRTAERQYERELLFSSLVSLVSRVVMRIHPSVHAAYQKSLGEISVSVKALYDKLSHVEPNTSRALVQHSARGRRIGQLLQRDAEALAGGFSRANPRRQSPWEISSPSESAASDRGRRIAGSLSGAAGPRADDHRRRGVLRGRSCAGADDVGGRASQHRGGDLLIDDRNFCTLGFLFAVMDRGAYFITRQHGRMPWTPVTKPRYAGRTETGVVYRQDVELRDPETGRIKRLRRITVKLNKPTRDGDAEIHLLTNLPLRRASATQVAELYRERWTLETAFQEMTTQLRCELQSLGYPKAALFGFCVAVCCYNVLAALKGALRSTYGEETIQAKVSNYFLTDEITGTYRGMMVALPPAEWQAFQSMSKTEFAAQLCEWASEADLSTYPKHKWAPKKPKQARPNAQFQHVSTARLLDEERIRKITEMSECRTP